MVSVGTIIFVVVIVTSFGLVFGAPRVKEHAGIIWSESWALVNDIRKSVKKKINRTAGYVTEGIGHVVHKTANGVEYVAHNVAKGGKGTVNYGKNLRGSSKKKQKEREYEHNPDESYLKRNIPEVFDGSTDEHHQSEHSEQRRNSYQTDHRK